MRGLHRRHCLQTVSGCRVLEGKGTPTAVPIFPEFTTVVTGHGKLRSYLHRFGLTDNSMYTCKEEKQITNHLVFQCKKLRNQRNEMIKQIKHTGSNWPTTNETLVNNYLQIFCKIC